MNNYNKNTIFEGTVRWFSDNLGYGFIESDEFQSNGTNVSIFAHFSKIVSGAEYKTLSKGQFVQFEVAESDKGLMAVNIQEKKLIKTKASLIQQ
jgi:cold shock protein